MPHPVITALPLAPCYNSCYYAHNKTAGALSHTLSPCDYRLPPPPINKDTPPPKPITPHPTPVPKPCDHPPPTTNQNKMANIIPFLKIKALENIECQHFASIDGCIVNIETIKPDIDEDFENMTSELGCQLEDGRWIIVRWVHGDEHSQAYPAYYSCLWDAPVSINAARIEYELPRISPFLTDAVKKQVQQWLPHLTDEDLAADVSNAMNCLSKFNKRTVRKLS